MIELTLKEKLRHFIGGTAFKIFLWAERMTYEEYWKEIQIQENAHDDYYSMKEEFL